MAELVRLKVDVIFSSSTSTAVAAKNATRTIPIVMATGGDVVKLGLAASLARNPSYAPAIGNLRAAARALGVQLQMLDVRGPNELDDAFAAMARERVGALLVFSGPEFAANRALILNLGAKRPRAANAAR